MQIPVLIEPIPGVGFRATAGLPWSIAAEGPTRDEALRTLRERIGAREAAGAEIVPLDWPGGDYPPPGDLKDDPLLGEWKDAMADYRRQVDLELGPS